MLHVYLHGLGFRLLLTLETQPGSRHLGSLFDAFLKARNNACLHGQDCQSTHSLDVDEL